MVIGILQESWSTGLVVYRKKKVQAPYFTFQPIVKNTATRMAQRHKRTMIGSDGQQPSVNFDPSANKATSNKKYVNTAKVLRPDLGVLCRGSCMGSLLRR
jgi:hypothetical protein